MNECRNCTVQGGLISCLEKVKEENTKLKTALSGRTYFHDNAAVEKELEAARAHIARLTEGRQEELKHVENAERKRCKEVALAARRTVAVMATVRETRAHNKACEEIAAAIIDRCRSEDHIYLKRPGVRYLTGQSKCSRTRVFQRHVCSVCGVEDWKEEEIKSYNRNQKETN